MKSFLFSLLAAIFIFPLSSFAATQRWVIHEDQPNGRVRVRVIEGQDSEAVDQSALTQDIIFDRTMTVTEFSTFDANSIAMPALALPQAGRPLWIAKQNSWTQADEDDYSAWFAQNATVNFMDGSGLKVDCSDTALTFRWVYARDHQLPIANTLSGSGRIFGHFSANAAWDKLPTNSDWKKDERFKAALKYLYNNSYSSSVVKDLAPTFINNTYVRPGSIFMIIRKGSGHTQSIKTVDLTKGLTTIWGNEPASATIYQTPIEIEVDQKQTFGIWRPVRLNGQKWELTPATQTPGYSLEQFQNISDEDAYMDWYESRLGIHVSDADKLDRSTQQIYIALGERLMVTIDGIFACYYQTCSPSSAAYDDYSTFSRDGRLKTSQANALALAQKLGDDNQDVINWKNNLMPEEIIYGTGLTYKDLILNPSLVNALNPDPRVSFAARWGLNDKDSNISFFAASSVMLTLLSERTGLVERKQSSAAIDANIRRMLAIAHADMMKSDFISASTGKIITLYNLCPISLTTGDVTFNDVLWGHDGKDDLTTHWSSSASATLDARWGQP